MEDNNETNFELSNLNICSCDSIFSLLSKPSPSTIMCSRLLFDRVLAEVVVVVVVVRLLDVEIAEPWRACADVEAEAALGIGAMGAEYDDGPTGAVQCGANAVGVWGVTPAPAPPLRLNLFNQFLCSASIASVVWELDRAPVEQEEARWWWGVVIGVRSTATIWLLPNSICFLFAT